MKWRRLGLIAQILFGVFLVVFAYGLYRFPDAPIRQVGGQYVGKYSAIHSREDFEQLRIWERVYITTFAATFVSAVLLRFGKRREG